MSSNNTSLLVSIPETVKVLGVSKYFVNKAIASGTLETAVFEDRVYVLRESLDKVASAFTSKS